MPAGTLTATLDSATLADWRRDGVGHAVVDVRAPAEFHSAHIPGSFNLPPDRLGEHRDELSGGVGRPVVLVCRSGGRAARAQQRLAEAGMPDVHVLDGGILAWEAAGGEVVRGEQRWALERQVRLAAGVLVLGGILGSLAAPRLKYLSGAVGAGLTFAALTDTCAMGALLARLPYNRGAPSCDVDDVVGRLVAKG